MRRGTGEFRVERILCEFRVSFFVQSQRSSTIVFLTFCFRLVRCTTRLFMDDSTNEGRQRTRAILGRSRRTRRNFRSNEIAISGRRLRRLHGLIVSNRHIIMITNRYRAHRTTRFAQGNVSSGKSGTRNSRNGRQRNGAIITQSCIRVLQFILSSVIRLYGITQYFLSDRSILRITHRARNHFNHRIRSNASQRVMGRCQGVYDFNGDLMILMGTFLQEFVVVEGNRRCNVRSYRILVFRHIRRHLHTITTSTRRGERAAISTFCRRFLSLSFFFLDRYQYFHDNARCARGVRPVLCLVFGRSCRHIVVRTAITLRKDGRDCSRSFRSSCCRG